MLPVHGPASAAALYSTPQRAVSSFFFFNDTATTELYTLSLHDALPISRQNDVPELLPARQRKYGRHFVERSQEHTSELQSRGQLVCRLLREKKNQRGHRRANPDARDKRQLDLPFCV